MKLYFKILNFNSFFRLNAASHCFGGYVKLLRKVGFRVIIMTILIANYNWLGK